MMCGLSKSDHWKKERRFYLNSPMYHCENRCPYHDGDCISHCGTTVPYLRPCLLEDHLTGLSSIQILKEQRGASAVEYALLVALISGMIIAAIGLFGDSVRTLFDSVNSIWPALP
jgi:Flp pilus assembly pilin Flp